MYNDLEKKNVLVTGAGKKTGIGYAIAREFASQGANVVIADLGFNESSSDEVSTGTKDEMSAIAGHLKTDYNIHTLAVNLDVTKSNSVQKMAEKIKDEFGHIDILCNNAGAVFGVPNGIHTYGESAWMKTIDVNLNGVFRVSKAVVPLMLQKGGAIVNTASRAGKVPALFNGAYAAAKAGVIMMTKVMAKELAGHNIRVNAVCPGQIMTDFEHWRFSQEAKFFGSTVEERKQAMCQTIPLGRIGSPEEVAKLVSFLASDASSYCTGQALNITGGQLMEL